MTSRGKNFVIINKNALSMLENCFNKFGTVSPVTCEKLIVHNLVPKFLILHLKSSEVEVNSELMIHDSCKIIPIIFTYYIKTIKSDDYIVIIIENYTIYMYDIL